MTRRAVARATATTHHGPTFLGVWPILDDTRTLPELVAEADRELVLLAWEQGLVCTALPTWSVCDTADGTATPLDGLPSPTGMYLVCRAPARRHTARHWRDYDTGGSPAYGAALPTHTGQAS